MKFFIITILAAITYAQQYDGCTGTPNNQPLITDEPKLVKKVDHGQKYVVPYDGRYFYVLNLTGNAYEMGYAYGQLMKDELPPMIEGFFGWAAYYIENNVSDVISRLPKFMKTWIGETGVELAKKLLDLNYIITKEYTNKRWDDEMQGLSDGSGQAIEIFRQINLIPELLKASCSIFGAYGKASSTGKLLHLRCLDWEEHAPMSRWPLITVYHSTEANSVPFANIAWPAFIGTLTGYNSMKVGIGQRLGGAPAGDETRFGTPWNYVLRDALQFAKTQQDAIQFLTDAKRTCAVYLGVGGENFFEICEYSAAYMRHYNWTNWHFNEVHPMLEDTLWKAYNDDKACFKSIVEAKYGNITAEDIYRLMAPMAQTGDSQVVVMDYAEDLIYANYPNPVTFDPGYVRPTIRIDMKPFFAKTAYEYEMIEI